MRPFLTAWLSLGAALALAGCNGDARKETGGKADGEILPASVSDDMLPHDTVRSQAPLAPKADDGAAVNDKGKQGTEPKAPQLPEAAAGPAPAEPAEPAE